MGIFGKLFGSKKLKTIDSDFGEIESFSSDGDRIGWMIKRNYLETPIEILIDGSKYGISEHQKKILLEALNKETEIKSESELALREQYDNAEMKFVSIKDHFDFKAIFVRDKGFELSFQQAENPKYYFHVHFENNRQIGVSING